MSAENPIRAFQMPVRDGGGVGGANTTIEPRRRGPVDPAEAERKRVYGTARSAFRTVLIEEGLIPKYYPDDDSRSFPLKFGVAVSLRDLGVRWDKYHSDKPERSVYVKFTPEGLTFNGRVESRTEKQTEQGALKTILGKNLQAGEVLPASEVSGKAVRDRLIDIFGQTRGFELPLPLESITLTSPMTEEEIEAMQKAVTDAIQNNDSSYFTNRKSRALVLFPPSEPAPKPQE